MSTAAINLSKDCFNIIYYLVAFLPEKDPFDPMGDQKTASNRRPWEVNPIDEYITGLAAPLNKRLARLFRIPAGGQDRDRLEEVFSTCYFHLPMASELYRLAAEQEKNTSMGLEDTRGLQNMVLSLVNSPQLSTDSGIGNVDNRTAFTLVSPVAEQVRRQEEGMALDGNDDDTAYETIPLSPPGPRNPSHHHLHPRLPTPKSWTSLQPSSTWSCFVWAWPGRRAGGAPVQELGCKLEIEAATPALAKMRLRASSDIARRSRPRYIYEPLAPRHIRVLTLIHYDAKAYQVYARIDQVDIDNLQIGFTALSYTWRQPVEEFTQLRRAPSSLPASPHHVDLLILPREAFKTFKRRDDLAADGAMLDTYTTNVGSIPIGRNLSDWFVAYLDGWPAKHMAATRNPYEVTVFWIDAVCINQADAAEKATQIPLMGHIYSSASRVLGWLGADATDLATFRWWHDVVVPQLQGFFRQRGGEEAVEVLRGASFADASFWQENLGLEPLEGSWTACWTAYVAFYLTRNWFKRAWIVQEAVLAGKLRLQCADVELPWLALAEFSHTLGKVNWLDGLDVLAAQQLPLVFTEKRHRGLGITDLFGLQRDEGSETWHIQSHGWAYSWWAVICAVRRRQCLFPQDKVYATLGFMDKMLGPAHSLPVGVSPGATAEDVFTQAATALLLSCPQLTALSFVEPPSRRAIKGLPSWVPDLTVSEFGWPIGAFDTTFSAGVAKGGSSPAPVVTGYNELELRGFRAAVVNKVYARPLRFSPELCITALEILASLPEVYPYVLGGQDKVAALVHCMTCMEASNPFRGTPEETAKLARDFGVWLLAGLARLWAACRLGAEDEAVTSMWRAERARAAGLLASLGSYPLIPSVGEVEEHAATLSASTVRDGGGVAEMTTPRSFKDQIQRLLEYRRVFVGTDGWLGVCREDCKEGDEVWILDRGAVPYSLRPAGGEYYEFLGEAYLHGAMHGELLGQKEFETGWKLDVPSRDFYGPGSECTI
ncbi:heterokaryon incompatibility protein-domain-containing protein [Lasiosphaeris hirsuta]|uniref:Heterokaryon incompatibility protein-domain-containing protein n=1 Tax=Lasiosphaeris hirsuta TaxID=260670 RepID=A0AA40AGB9_9PEZI|nr:heterokaryon incompatibility protein-domain-containing protein [Lasiosphaeris hirsuta]